MLKCYANQLTHLDTSGLTALNTLYCANNQLTSLDFSNLPQLRFLTCHNNQFTDLDLSNLSELEYLMCQNNQLTSLNVANGINANNWKMWAHNNPDLTCIQHDENFDPNTNIQWKKDDTANWNTNCNIMATDDVNPSENKVKVYPNPFKKILHISSIEEVERIYIMDMSGKVVQSFTPQKELHLPHLNAGMYTVQLSYKDGSAQTMKVIKK
ncbi:MAG: hypothetical protein CSA38_05705 [Flavobacteriales bacterium]|nr:MAG: hypothetical protein CSA38_05705 [Flavobacteriales bacterium]